MTDKIQAQIASIQHLIDYDVDPRKDLHLDTTKLAWHKERLEQFLAGEKIAPITIDMALTQKCAYACSFCYANLQVNPSTPTTWSVYQHLLEDCAEVGVKAISLVSDGESTLNPFFYDFVHYGKSLGIDMAVGTNGQVLNPDRLEQLLKDLTYLRFNFSAGEPDAYAKIMGCQEKWFHGVVENIKRCVTLKREHKLPVTVGLQMVLMEGYLDQVIPLALLGRNLGVDYLVIKHCGDDEEGRLGIDYQWYKQPEVLGLLKTAEALSTEKYSVQAKWSKIKQGRDRKYDKCFGAPLHLQMSGTCLVAPCGAKFHPRYAEQFHIGNYAKTRFKDILQSDRYWEVMGFLKGGVFDPRKDCCTLCLQDKSNEVLYDIIENGADIPSTRGKRLPQHINFL